MKYLADRMSYTIFAGMKKLLMMFALLAMTMMAQAQERIDLWPQGAPHVSSNAKDTAFVKVFLTPAEKATGRAVVICPCSTLAF